VILCPNGHENPDGTTYCSQCFSYIDASAPTVEPPLQPDQPEPLVSLSPPSLAVPPGGEGSCDVLLESRAETSEHYDVEITGEAASWAAVDPASLELAPAAVGAARLTFRPPASAVPGGEFPYAVKVASRERPEAPALVSGRLQLGSPVSAPAPPGVSTPALAVQLRPETSKGRTGAEHVLIVQNLSADTVTSEPTAVIPDSGVAIAFDPPSAAVPAGGTVAIRVRVRPRETLWLGRRDHAFRVLVAHDAEVTGVMVQRPRVPVWLAVVPVLAVGAVAAVALVRPDDQGIDGRIATPSGANVREGPAQTEKRVGGLKADTEIRIDCRVGDQWFRLNEPSEFEGKFVAAGLVDSSATPERC
jgi:hypothetical protein